MNVKEVRSYAELESMLKENDRIYLLLYKKGSEQSECALEQFRKASEGIKSVLLLAADVSQVKDIHGVFNISSAPTMIEFENAKAGNIIKGCHESAYFKAILEDAVYRSEAKASGKPAKRVTVYSTPTCTWCNTLKSYLRQNKIRFTDIDVSRDQNAAQELVRRSGQQGVPQTEINGTIVVGFDKNRLNELLEIRSN